MEHLVFSFYRCRDVTGPDGKSLDRQRLAAAEPLDSVKGNPRAVLGMHLKHLGFYISRMRPDLEGKELEATVVLKGRNGKPENLMLLVFHGSEVVAQRIVMPSTLDADPFLSVLLKRRPELQGADLVYTVSPASELGKK
jgi:hypothetical protein